MEDTESITNNPNDYWIIDTDYGYDDQIAFPFLVKKLNVIAITLCHRSPKTDLNLVKTKLINDLKKIGKENIQVFIGSDRPYIDYVRDLKDDEIIDPYNFKNEFSNSFSTNKDENKKGANFQNADADADTKSPQAAANPTDYISNVAAVKILELIRTYGKKLNIFCLGPLTNLSLAVILDTSIRYLFDKLYIVGGSVFNFGNSGNSSEYNFRCDPVAAKSVIMNFKNIHLLSLEIDLFLRDKRKELLGLIEEIKASPRDVAKIKLSFDLAEFLENFKFIYEREEEDPDFYHSLFGFTAVVLVLYPELMIKKNVKVLPCDVDIFGRKTRGALMIQNYEHLKNGKFNELAVISDFDINEYLDCLRKLLTEEIY